MVLEFTKMHGLGNDFVVFNALHRPLRLNAAQLRLLADRHFGVGCDQVLVLEPAVDPAADFRYRIFNADGGEVEQCGNGLRCVAQYLRDEGLVPGDSLTLETRGGLVSPRFEADGQITVDMGRPEFAPARIPFRASGQANAYTVEVAGQRIELGAVAMGNPHAVLEVPSVADAPVAELGPLLEGHERFPARVNVGFMEVMDDAHIRLRVYERGVGETLACGTGASAAVAVGRRQGRLRERVAVDLPGGRLIIQWAGGDAPLLMTGPAVRVFEGRIKL
ncbi:MAG TPA: diaminopimelate epimerase [Gammaproteobacteria bacterium]|nr:diaminopimelate epimerase [Gammaproteobacteria bacterium]